MATVSSAYHCNVLPMRLRSDEISNLLSLKRRRSIFLKTTQRTLGFLHSLKCFLSCRRFYGISKILYQYSTSTVATTTKRHSLAFNRQFSTDPCSVQWLSLSFTVAGMILATVGWYSRATAASTWLDLRLGLLGAKLPCAEGGLWTFQVLNCGDMI